MMFLLNIEVACISNWKQLHVLSVYDYVFSKKCIAIRAHIRRSMSCIRNRHSLKNACLSSIHFLEIEHLLFQTEITRECWTVWSQKLSFNSSREICLTPSFHVRLLAKNLLSALAIKRIEHQTFFYRCELTMFAAFRSDVCNGPKTFTWIRNSC